MGNTDFDRKPDQHGSQNIPGEGQGVQTPTSDQDSEQRDTHSLPGTNQAGRGPGEDDEDDRPDSGSQGSHKG